jgi:hypothetical protein
MKVINPKKKIAKRCLRGAPAIYKIEKDMINKTTDDPRSGSNKTNRIEKEITNTGLKKPSKSSLNSSYFLMQ